jgi:hypothetical protein
MCYGGGPLLLELPGTCAGHSRGSVAGQLEFFCCCIVSELKRRAAGSSVCMMLSGHAAQNTIVEISQLDSSVL